MWPQRFRGDSRAWRATFVFLTTTTVFNWEAANGYSLTDSTGGYSSGGSSDCIAEYISDGWCDQSNNLSVCDYDGGDCCSCMCVDTTDYSCGINGFDCQDPTASCYLSSGTDYTSNSCDDPDGWCDSGNNVAACDYDGGDCCSCTCSDNLTYTCGINDFNCLDLSASCYGSSDDDTSVSPSGTTTIDITNDTSTTSGSYDETTDGANDDVTNSDSNDDVTNSDSNDDYPSCTMGVIAQIGDGDCNTINNVLVCGYDGGDCCSCTCEDPTTGAACDTTYDCQNIHASCYDPDATSVVENSSSSSSSSSSNDTLYIALGAGGGGILAIAAIVLYCFFAHKKTKKAHPSELPGPQPQPPAATAPPAYPTVEAPIARAPPAYEEPPAYDGIHTSGGGNVAGNVKQAGYS